MRRAVRALIEHADRGERCPGMDACRIVRKKHYCPDYCKCMPPEEVDEAYVFRYQRACSTLMMIESLGLRFRDLEWQEIPDLVIVVTERNYYYAERAKKQNGESQKNSLGGN